MNSLNDFCPTHFRFLKLSSKWTFQKNWKKGCLWIPFGREKNVHSHQLNGKANTGEEGAGMGRNHKSALWAGWAWVISYPISWNCRFHTRQGCSYAVKTHLLCPSCLSKEGHIPKVAPNSQARPPGRQPGEPEGHVQTWPKTTASHFLLRPRGKCLLALRDSSTWWEGWCEWRRKPVWEGGTEKSVWVSRRRGQLSQISSLSPLFKNMTNPWLQWIYIQ